MHFRSQKKTAMDVSLSEMIDTGKDGNALSLMEVIRSDEDLFDDLSNREMYGKLHQALDTCLSDRERNIISLRYGLGGTQPLTQREIAAKCGISRSYVSRIEKKALEKLEAGARGLPVTALAGLDKQWDAVRYTEVSRLSILPGQPL